MSPQDFVNAAELKIANQVLANYVALTNGALTVDWFPFIKATRGVLAVQNQINIGDQSSTNFLKAYSCLQYFVGQYAGGPIDPNAQNPNTIIDVNEVIFEAPVVELPFNNVTGVTVNWQTDIAPVFTETYANIFGNSLPNPIVYFGTPDTLQPAGNQPTVTLSGGIIQTVVFDFGLSSSGVIRF